MKCLVTAGSFLLLFVLADEVQASLIFNGSFEQVPNSNTGAGLLPTGWFHTNPSLPASSRASTFSNDGGFALHRINPHAPPLVRAPVNSFEF